MEQVNLGKSKWPDNFLNALKSIFYFFFFPSDCHSEAFGRSHCYGEHECQFEPWRCFFPA